MKVVRSLPAPDDDMSAMPIMLAVGFFDGLHLGHQRVIHICREQAAAQGAEAWVMTFEPHPLRVVNPLVAPKLLTALPAKLDLLRKQQVDGCAVTPFTHAFSELSPEDFLNHLVFHFPKLRGLVIGANWRFGRQAQGDVRLLQEISRARHLTVTVASPLLWRDQPISSTRIREAVAEGRLDDAAAMLGRAHTVRSPVVHGTKRGRRLGFPTANLDCTHCALPPPGIYAAHVMLDQERHPGAVYLPAHGEPGLLEVHVIDFNGDLYGRDLEVEFAGKIRDDNLRFSTDPALIGQIQSDIHAIRAVLKHRS